nr:PREDICTED: ankyrin repeat domain-containing protein 50 isoform X1 [Bemisia tabaci]
MTSSQLEKKRFYCREWVFVKLSNCLSQRSSSKKMGALIVGGPGSGKTAICCEAVWPSSGTSAKPQRSLNRYLLAYHFCQAQDLTSLSVVTFIQSLVEQLCAKSDELCTAYTNKIKSDPRVQAALETEALLKDPHDGFKKAVLLPLLELDPPKHSVFLLVDSIDEGQSLRAERRSQELRTIAGLLAEHHHLFPNWLLLVCTARRQSKTVAKMFSGFRKLCIDDLRKSQVIRDIQQYILSRLESEESLRQHMSKDTAEMLNQLHIKSNGCFLYLERVLDGVGEGCIILREVKEIPGTLNGLYLWLCQRLLSTKHFSKVRPLLNIMLASQRPCTEAHLEACFHASLPSHSPEDFRRRFHLLKRVSCILRDGAVLPFHYSFVEWLLDVKHCTRRFLCSSQEGHMMLALFYTQRGNKLTGEEIRDLAYHLSQINLWAGAVDATLLAKVWLLEAVENVTPALETPCLDKKAWKLLTDLDHHSNASQISNEAASTPVSEKDAVSELLAGDVDVRDSSGKTQLHNLAAEANHVLLETILTACPDVDIEATDKRGQTPLNLAARHGHPMVVEVLLNGGADVNHADDDGWTALRAAAWGGHTQVVESLLRCGADVDSRDMDGRTALRAAAWGGHNSVVKKLLENGADPNARDAEGRTALIAAAYMGHSEIVSVLLEYGADINHQDSDGRTALSVAALCVPANEGYAKVVSILLEKGAEVDHEDKDGMTPLLVAAFEGHKDVCELLLEAEADVDHCDKAGRTPLWAAASMGHAECVALLLFWGCCIDSIDSEGRTVLSVAAAQGNVGVVSQLVDRGLDEQHRDNSGWTPLHYAAFEGHTEVCRVLLEAGAKVDQTDNDGKAPLMLAAQEGHVSLVKELLTDHGAPPDQKALDGRSALRLAALEDHIDVVRILLAEGADINAKDADSRSTLYILALENRLPVARFFIDPGGADVESTDSEGRTALHVSSWQGHAEMVILLLTLGKANVNAVDNENRTSLHSAAWQGHSSIVKILLEHGAIPDFTCNQGATALGIAAQEGHEACVRLLLMHGANPLHSDHCGRNAMRVAAKSGHETVLKLLEQFSQSQHRNSSNGGNGNSSGSGSTAETKPSSAILVPGGNPVSGESPIESPESTAKRRSLVSSRSKSSSNLTNSTKSSHQETIQSQAPLSFTQQLQQCSRGKARSSSKILSPQSPIYATPPHSPDEPPPTAFVSTDEHFSRDTHMKIILGNKKPSRKSPAEKKSHAEKKRNGIVTNPALRLVPAIRSGLEIAAGRRSFSQSAHTATNSFQWRKETPL